MNSTPHRVTLREVADQAKVSKATASLVVRNSGKVSVATRQRVRDVMDDLGYVYHRGAASLRGRRSASIGVIVPDVSIDFTAELTMGLESTLLPQGFVTLVSNTIDDRDRQELIFRNMLERQVDGIVMIPSLGTDDRLAQQIEQSGIPTVMATRSESFNHVPYVGIDNVKSGRLAGEHLLSHGAQQVAYIGGLAGINARRDRIAGLEQVLHDAGGSVSVDIPGPPLGGWARDTTRQLLAEDRLPTAVVCHNDVVAFGLYRALRERTPNLISSVHVISNDDIAAAELWEPPLTTVAARGAEVGRLAAEVLLRRIEDPAGDVEHVQIDSELIIRRSCGQHD